MEGSAQPLYAAVGRTSHEALRAGGGWRSCDRLPGHLRRLQREDARWAEMGSAADLGPNAIRQHSGVAQHRGHLFGWFKGKPKGNPAGGVPSVEKHTFGAHTSARAVFL